MSELTANMMHAISYLIMIIHIHKDVRLYFLSYMHKFMMVSEMGTP